METREFIQNIIDNFDLQRLKRFFSEKNNKFRPSEESFDYYNTDNFSAGLKLGELALDDGTLLVCAFEAKQELSERSGKKAQYELGKKILKETQTDAGIFIYHNQAGSFRFSLIYANYLGKKRDWSAFRRFTYFVGNDLTNKTFKQRIGNGDFYSLEKIKDAFSVEKVTKEFYEDIANWYFWAVEHSTFPKDAEAEKDGRNIAIIRLITRIIFIWFMRERGLVPKDLFEEKNITSILKSISAEDSTYYTAILQNLFFATLSTKKDERKFRSEIRGYKGYNPDFGNQNVFRFQELFKNSEKLKEYFGEIPFLNGGLFECLDDKPNGIYIDGFTSVKKNQPNVPNFLFFSEEKKADLNKAYGTQNKKYIVSGLFNILSSFNFTIDENSPDDADVALDPELLGRVFENLLASFNPETSTTARKATGSYYTPREIVDYMVTESLKAYFKTHLSAISDLDKKIVQLFSIESEENPFDKSESKKLVGLIESVRIVDPAVGSGAFPMGALNKLVFVLNKVDPGNELWKQAQLSAADTIPDPRIKQDTKNRIEDFFKGKNADYGRKLYLIQKCIYGVDIQQIAVEIAKLRFFISLLVHEDIDKKKENWGIEPLPNLDFKIMQGNSLLEEYEGIKLFDEKLIASIDFGKQELFESIKQKQSELQKEYLGLHAKNQLTKFKQAELNEELKKLDKQLKGLNKQDNNTEESAGLFDAQNEAKQKSEMLKRLHKEFFETSEKETKDKIKKQIEKIGWDLIEATLKEQNKTSELKKIEQFKKSNTKPFFLWKLNFAEVFEKGGFDIVIGNPPWGQKSVKFSESEKKLFKKIYPSATIGILDISRLFIERAITILNTWGSFANVLPDIILLKYYDSTRKYILDNLLITRIDHWGRAFESVNLDSCTLIGKKTSTSNKNTNIVECTIHTDSGIISNKILQTQFLQTEGYKFNLYLSSEMYELINKLKRDRKFGDYFEHHEGIHSGNIRDKLFIDNKINNNCQKLIFGRDEISKYHLFWKGKWVNYDKNIINKVSGEYAGLGKPEYFEKHKIIVRRTGDFILGALDEDGYYFSNNVFVCVPKKDSGLSIKYVLGILNSKFATWFYRTVQPRKGKIFAELKINVLKQIPIKETSHINQKPIIELVDKLLIAKKNDFESDTSVLQNAIDQLVYDIFELTKEQRQAIEKS